MQPEFTTEEFRLFGDWLAEEYGLRFGPERRDILRSRLEPRRAELGFDTFEQLYFHLKFHPDREAERQHLLPRLTNNESYFFRERPQLQVLREEVLPTLRRELSATARREMRVLSAGCAAGEEAFTLAIIAQEAGLLSPPWRTTVTGIDLDPKVLERARAGCYTAHAFRGVDDELRNQHFTAAEGKTAGDRWQIAPNLRAAVDFRQVNLVDPGWPAEFPPQDVIFCRNVLIYFDTESMTRAVNNLYRALVPGGYLFLGHAESLNRIPTRLCPVRRAGAIFYRRPANENNAAT